MFGPVIFPYARVSRHDQDDFITNQVTIAGPVAGGPLMAPAGGTEVPLSPSADDRAAVLTLDEIKIHLRIEMDQTAEDDYLTQLEMGARIHTENSLRRPGGLTADAPENVKVAMLLLIAHWYRNREAIGSIKLGPLPLAYEALLATEREYSSNY